MIYSNDNQILCSFLCLWQCIKQPSTSGRASIGLRLCGPVRGVVCKSLTYALTFCMQKGAAEHSRMLSWNNTLYPLAPPANTNSVACQNFDECLSSAARQRQHRVPKQRMSTGGLEAKGSMGLCRVRVGVETVAGFAGY